MAPSGPGTGAAVPVRAGGRRRENPDRWAEGYASFTHPDTSDLVELLRRYLIAAGVAGAATG